MSLSWILIIILPLFSIPLIILPNNKVRIFSISLFIGISIVVILNILNALNNSVSQTTGKIMYPLYSWMVKGNIELNQKEKYHVSFIFTQALFFSIITISSYIVFNLFYIGKNPSIKKNGGKFFNIFLRIITYLGLYLTFSFFLISIRNLTSLEDGFLKDLFNLIYYIGA